MASRQAKALIFLLVIIAILAIFAILTDSINTIICSNPLFLILACLFFLFSIVTWIFSWARLLLNKHPSLGVKNIVLAGFSAVYASLTPLQLGAEALRALNLKQLYGTPLTDSIAASMIVKGMKFLLIAIIASLIVLLFFLSEADMLSKLILLSGFIVIVAAALLFLLPMNKKIGLKIAFLFKKLSRFWSKFSIAEKYFANYSTYFQATSKKSLAIILAIVAFSLLLEFFSLFFSFQAAYVTIPMASVITLFIIISVLERAPFLPRGIGLVEVVGLLFLSVNAPEIEAEKLAAVIILFDIARLAVPTILSLIVYSVTRQIKKPVH